VLEEQDLRRALGLVKKGFFNVKEAAVLRQCSKAAIHLLIKRKRLRKVELFGQLLVYKRELKNFEEYPPGPRPGSSRKNEVEGRSLATPKNVQRE
jgi:hypothetical protein